MLRQLVRAGPIDDLRLLVQHGEDAVERRGGGEERVVELGELLDRVEEVRKVEREREERPDAEVPVDHEPAAEAEDDGGGERREDVDRREVHAVQDDGLVVRGAVAVVHTPERRLARRLARERLHDAHAGDVLGERRRHEAEALPHPAVGAVRADAEPRGRGRHQRKHDERREGEAPVEDDEDHGGAEEQEGVLDEARDAVGDELVERVDVVGDAADRCARPVALVVPERQLLEVPEEPDPEVRQAAFADPAREVRLEAREHEGGDAREKERGDDDRERMQIAVVDPAVDREPGEVGRKKGDTREGDECHDREQRPAPIRPGKLEERPQAAARLCPRPVVDAGAARVGEVGPGLPDLHRAASVRTRRLEGTLLLRGTPSHHPPPA